MNDALWTPQNPKKSQMWQFMQTIAERHQLTLDHYQQLHQWSIDYPEYFWEELARFFQIQWDTPPTSTLKVKSMFDAQWFPGAQLNFAEKLLSRRDHHPALICINELGLQNQLSYQQLYQKVAECAMGLKKLGIQSGDRVAAVLPNTEYAIIAMLATTSIGAIWSSCSPDFGAQAAVDRLGQITPKLLFICDGHQYQGKQHSSQEKIDLMLKEIQSIQHVVLCPNINADLNKTNHCVDWDLFLQPADHCEFASMPFSHPVYIMFSSGTTGKPKCIVHGAGGTLLQHIKELGLHCDLRAEDNLLFYTTCGWMMWNWLASALALGTTITLYEGSPTYPNAQHLFDIIEEFKVTVFGTGAKFISAIDKEGIKPNAQHSLNTLRLLLSTGSPLLPKNYDYVYEHIKSDVQLSSISGGTDIISCFALGNPIMPVYKGELQCLGLGMAVEVFNEDGVAEVQTRGELVCTKPFPSMPVGFWNDPERSAYHRAYFERFENVWTHGDFAEITEHQGLIIYGRSDAVLNPGGVRIGTAEIYRQVEKVEAVVDSIVIGQNWDDDVRVVLFVKLKEGLNLDENLIQTIKQTIRANASPRHVPAKIVQVSDIPKTMSGKIVEIAVRQVVHGEEIKNRQSLANPESLEYFRNRPELQ